MGDLNHLGRKQRQFYLKTLTSTSMPRWQRLGQACVIILGLGPVVVLGKGLGGYSPSNR